MAEELFKKKISREEKIYREARDLQEAVSCVLRFENEVAALGSAARKFQKLENYKDAKARMEECRAAAAKAAERGAREVFEEILLSHRSSSVIWRLMRQRAAFCRTAISHI